MALGFKNDMTNLINFNASCGILICTLMYYICQYHINFQLKSAEELSLITLKSDPNFEEKLTFCLKNDMRNLLNFNSNSENSENFHFDGIFLSKVCNV